MPIMGWNAHMFEFLTRVIERGPLPQPDITSTTYLVTKNYIYLEGKRAIFILGMRPIRSLSLFLALKRVNIALFYVSLGR